VGFSQSKLAARMQEMVSLRREEAGLYAEIANLLPLADSGRLLDVGTGTGLQLKVIRELKPGLELFGLDLSAQAVRIARGYFEGTDVDLREGSIERTNYEDNFFDLVTCASSMSYWKNLQTCFDEIHRILKPGGAAHLIEPRKDIDIDAAIEIIRQNLAGESKVRIFLATNLNRFGLRWGRTLGLKLYSADEVAAIANRSRFGDQVTIQPVVLQNLPIFMQIVLSKPGDEDK
jgi:ubiquinone/menaquinone biosynthesis C-methylase UbiE